MEISREDALKIWLPIIRMGVENMPECKESLDMAIASLKTDEAYQLMHEGGEVFTKADMVAMLEEIQTEIDEKAIELCDDGWWLTYNEIIQEKIDKLKENKE